MMLDFSRKPTTPETIYSDNIEVAPLVEDLEDVENMQLLQEEADQLTEQINSADKPNPFDLCRRGAILRKVSTEGIIWFIIQR